MKPALIEPLEARIAPAAVVSISPPSPAQENEGPAGSSKTVTFTISLDSVADADVTVDVSAVSESAVNGVDFTQFDTRAVTIPQGQLSATVEVTINGDTTDEPDETFALRIANLTGGADAIIGEDTARMTILDDDSAPTVSILNASHPEGNGDTPFGFTVQLSEISGFDVRVQIATATNGSADASDFDQIDQEFIIPAGQLEATFNVNVKGDTTAEGEETFVVNMTVLENAAPGITQATGTILEDDATVFTIDDITVTEGTNPKAIFTVKLSQAQASPVTIRYRTAEGSATVNSDYVEVPSTELTFAAGETEKTIEITLIDDNIFENPENFRVILSDQSVGDLPDPEATATIVDDDQTPTLTIRGPDNQVGTVTVDEGNSLRGNVFTLTLDRASSEPIIINLKTLAGSAAAGSDFTAINQDITFAAGETTKTITLFVNGDTTDESNETLQLEATGISGNVVLPASPTNVVLRNDELLITVNDVQVVEGNTGTKQMVFTVTLNTASNHEVSLGYRTTNGTASPADFTPIDTVQTLTFAVGETSKTITIDIIGDLAGETDEFFTLNFSDVTDATINKTSVRGTIIDDDPFLSIADAQVFEGGANTTRTMVFTVSLLRAEGGGTVTMDYTTGNAPTNPATGGTNSSADYLTTSGTLSFAPGETSKTISVTINGDSTNETDENFLVTLSNVTGLDPLAQSDLVATGKIIDDEGLVTVSNATIVEGDGGTANMVFVLNLTRSTGSNAAVKVDYATEDGTAISVGALADFTATSGSVTFAAGETQKTVSVPIRGDLLREGDQTFKFNVSVDNTGVAANDQASVATPSVIGTIVDNDPLPSFSVTGGSVIEGSSGAAIVFTINLTGGSEGPVSVNVATQPGTATTADFTAVSTQLVFTPGQTSATISVPVLDDDTLEGDEAFTVKLSNAVGATIAGNGEAIGVIRDNEIVVTLEAMDFAGPVTEGSNGTTTQKMKVKLSQRPLAGAPVTVNFSVTGVTATAGTDFVLLNPTTSLTFNAAEFADGVPVEKTIDFNIVGDALDEPANETFTVSLTGATNAVILTSESVKTATIADDDGPPSITIDDAQVTEGNSGNTTMAFTIRLSAPSGQAVSVTAETVAGTASIGSDFINTSQQITFAPGETVKTFSVTIQGDTNDEQNETFTVELSGVSSNATIADDTAIGTIIDNDARQLSIADARVAEGAGGTTTLTFKVRLSSAATQVVTVDYFTANGTALAGEDYVAATGTVTFAAGVVERDVVITINGDNTVELDETFFVRLQANANAPVNATIVDGEAVGTIQRDETQFTLDLGTPQSGAEEPVVPPGGGNPVAKTLTFKILRTGDLTQPGTATYTTVNGTAVAGKDFVAQSGTVNFAAGETQKEVTITLINDQNFELDETFSLQLSSVTNGIIVNDTGTPQATFSQTATILGSDTRPTVEISDATIQEGNAATTMTFTVKLRSGGQDTANEVEDIEVKFHTVAGTARDTASGLFAVDFNKIDNGSITFAKGETSKTFTIQIAGDSVDEHDETFTVVIDSAKTVVPQGAPSGTQPVDIVVTDGTAIGTIIDNDNAPVLTIGDLTVDEGSFGNATIKPKLELRVASGGAATHSEKDIVVTVTTVPGTANLGVDFTGPTTQTITIPAGTTTFDLNYEIIGDTIREADETFTLVLSNPQNTTLADGGSKVTIKNDDAVPLLSISNVTMVEADSGLSDMTFTVSLQGATDQPVTVNFKTGNGTAKSSGGLPDYLAAEGTLTFAPGETTKTITVSIIGDTWAELDENLTVTLSGAANATILTATGTGTIQNGGDTVVGLVVNDVISLENQFELNADGSLKLDSAGNPIAVSAADAKMLFLVELTKPLESNLTFSAQTRNGTAIANGNDADYTAVLASTTFTINAGSSSVNVPVALRGDSIFEATETFFLGIGNISNSAVLEARGEGRGVILNDDLMFVDTKTLRYIDEDGDLATIKISKGNLGAATLSFGIINPQTGGRVLQLLDFTSSPSLFNGTSVNISAEPQTGFAVTGRATDGHVDVGFIRGAIPDTNTLQFTRGIDFTNVTVEGDLGKITAGDLLTTPSIAGKISVHSIGVRGAATLPASEVSRDGSGNVTGFNNVSAFLSTVNAIAVTGDMMGVIQVIGSEFGTIRSLRIDGALRGDAAPVNSSINSGIVFFTGTLGKAVIGDIIGGANSDSGVINGNTAYVAKINSIHVTGDIIGGAGTRSGRIVAKTIGSVVVDGDLVGGGSTGFDADGVTPKGSDSGEILATAGLTSVKVSGDVKGGIQRNTGIISSGGSLNVLRIGGSLIGGTGSVDSGVIIVNRTLLDAAISGDIVGGAGERSGSIQVGGAITKFVLGKSGGTAGNVRGGAGDDSGMISAGAGFIDADNDGFRDDFVVSGGAITNALIYGDIVGGTGDGSGGVQTGGTIGKLDVRGDMIGGNAPGVGPDTSATNLLQSGFVLAGRLTAMTLHGDLRAGTNFGTGIADSGSIRVHENIGTLTIFGNVIGNETNRAIISAGNNGPATKDALGKTIITPAIKNLTVGKATTNASGVVTSVSGGIVSFLDVLAGYGEFGTLTDPRGVARTADAQIGTVNFRTSMQATNIVAGVDAGADNLFGTIDDEAFTATLTNGVTDSAKILSSIAKVIVGRSAPVNQPQPTDSILAHEDDHGIVAQVVSSVVANNLINNFGLIKGAGNDFLEISASTNVYVNEKV